MNRKVRFNERLKIAVGDKSARSVAHKCAISEAVLRKYLAGSSTPNVDRLQALSECLCVNIAWLANDEGPMRPGEAVQVSGDASTAPVAIDVELMGKIMTIFMQAAYDNQTTLPAKDIGDMAARAYQDILRDFPDPVTRQKALAQLTNIATNIARLYK